PSDPGAVDGSFGGTCPKTCPRRTVNHRKPANASQREKENPPVISRVAEGLPFGTRIRSPMLYPTELRAHTLLDATYGTTGPATGCVRRSHRSRCTGRRSRAPGYVRSPAWLWGFGRFPRLEAAD